ncbi:hypothetical protein [Listeria booriae]|uniref:hypothetical protein n=1 Tax=Listeria booriae TaxID=1552123 RepID=UPI00164E28F2|nr:hypothetical protein [Listeria booriae]MBC6301234.1 hypothetical protein [Listeria booriae]
MTQKSNNKYYATLVIAICYSAIGILSLIFATGVGNGIKLDDNQLVGYIVAIISLSLACFSFSATNIRIRRTVTLLLLILSLIFTVLPYVNMLSFNEAIFIFILPSSIFLLLIIFFGCDFLITTRKLK